jgi:hypothetical protein
MDAKRRFLIQSLLATLIFNAILLGVIYALAGNAIQAANQTIPFFAAGALITLLLWGAVYLIGSRLIDSAVADQTLAAPVTPPPAPTPAPAPTPQPARVRPQPPSRTAEAGAVQMLAILQRQGRLIDFLQENLSAYDDAQIGAAVRNIHEGCKQALADHVKLEPIFQEAEGDTVTVQQGFDTRAVRLTGAVAGEPPFRGALRHRGWRVVSIDLPQQADGQQKELIVAAAEVEVNG